MFVFRSGVRASIQYYFSNFWNAVSSCDMQRVVAFCILGVYIRPHAHQRINASKRIAVHGAMKRGPTVRFILHIDICPCISQFPQNQFLTVKGCHVHQ